MLCSGNPEGFNRNFLRHKGRPTSVGTAFFCTTRQPYLTTDMQEDGCRTGGHQRRDIQPTVPPCNKAIPSVEFTAIGRPHHLPDAKQLAAYLARAAFH